MAHPGDSVANEGLAAKKNTARSAQAKGRADPLPALVRGLPLGRIDFVPGDKDWANSGRDGLKAVRCLDKYIEKQLPGQNALVPTGGGPEVADVAPVAETLAFPVSYPVSPENSLVQFGPGFRIDK